MSTNGKRPAKAGLATRPQPQGRLSLILVIVNGLILTIAASSIIGIFANQMTQGQRDVAQTEVQQMISDRVRQIDADFQLISTLLPLPDAETRIRDMARSRTDEIVKMPFTHIVWLPVEESNFLSARRYYPAEEDPTFNLSAVLQEVLPVFKRLPKVEQERAKAVPLQKAASQHQSHHGADNGILRVNAGTLALVSRVRTQDGAEGFLIALMPAERLVNIYTLNTKSYFERLRFMSHQGANRVLDIFLIKDLGDLDPVFTDRRESVVPLRLPDWAGVLIVRLVLRQDDLARLIAFMPYLLFLFGCGLTALGALYVRNNYRQSMLMSRMNRTLALKNMELNSQVTERERLNQILRKNEREHVAIINSVTDIIFDVDTDGRFLFLNESWRNISGFEIAQAQGHNIFNYLDDPDVGEYRIRFEEMVRGQSGAFSFISRLKTMNGDLRTIEVHFSMMRLDDSRTMRVVGTITDIEERRRAEFALSEAERRYRTIWENAASGIYQTTVEGQLLTANPSLLKIFGYETSEEMIVAVSNMNRQLYANIKDRQTMIRDLMIGGQISGVEAEAIRKDGARFWIRESARVVKDDNGSVLYFEGSIDDITTQKEAEFRLRDAMVQSELANRSKTEFLANMSHELRTPLNAIIGFSEIIRDEVFGKIEQRQYWEYAKDIHESGKNLLTIINTILDVSRIEAGERQLNEAQVDVGTLVHSALDLIAPKAELNQQQLSAVIDEKLPNLVCEELAIKQVLLNLLSNAVKFTPTGGRITVLANLEKSGEIKLSVTDTGIGLDDEEIERVMTPFGGQASGSLSRSASGAGLGLTLVHSLMRMHGGRVEMFSQKGVGTTVAVIFPAMRARSV